MRSSVRDKRDKTIIQAQLSVLKPEIIDKMFNSLVTFFLNENYKLCLKINEEQINDICRTLLSGTKDFSDNSYIWKICEKNILNEYHKKELEIMDYLHLVSIDLRKQWGQYATPISIVRQILKSVGYESSKDVLNKKLLDPACGSGVFLIEAARVYLKALKKAEIPVYKWYPMVIGAMCGIDIDINACFFARLNLLALLAPSILEFVARNDVEKLKPLPIYCADTLQLIALEKERTVLLYNKFNMPLKNQFDFVVGNPPYFKIKKLSMDLKTTFSESIYGHPNAYGLFMHAGIEMLKEKGKLGFIIPRSMLSGLYFKNLRNFIERKTSIREIVYISDRKKVFDNVLHGTMILSVESNKKATKEIKVSFMESLKDMENINSKINIHRDKVIQRLNGSTVWFVADSPRIYNIIGRIVSKHPLLSGAEINCPAKTGQIVWNRVKPLLTTTTEQKTLPLVWATDVGKFRFSFNRMGISRPCFLKINNKIENLIVKGQSILIQRVTADEQPSRIVACILDNFSESTSKGYFVENHLNLIQPAVENSKTDLYFILGVLNSEIVEFFFRAMNGNTQVSATELNLLPIPIGKYEHDIAYIAKKIQKTPVSSSKDSLLSELNRLVAEAYGLSNGEHGFIRKNLKNRLYMNSNPERS